MSLHSINEYAKAKVIVKDLEKVLKVLNATEASLKKHKIYRPVYFILTTILEHKQYLEILLEEYKIILETKGEKRQR